MKKSRFLIILVCLSLIFTLASCDLLDSLKEVRAEAIAKVEALATEAEYANLNPVEVSKIIETAKNAINSAKTEEGIEKAVTNAKNALDKLVLDGVKAEAKAELGAYIDLSLYSDANKAVINGVIADASAAIDNCANSEAVATKLAEAKAALDEIKPALDEAKDGACASLDAYVDLALYSEDNKALIEAEIAAAKAEIEACETVEAVATRLNAAKATIDAIPTLLDTAKAEAVADIEGYIADLDAYSEENAATIARIINDAKTNIEAADSEELVAVIVEDAKADLDAVLTIVEEYSVKAQALKDIMVSVPTTTRDEIRIEDVVRDYVRIEDGKLLVDTVALDGEIKFYFGNQDRNTATVLDTYLVLDYQTPTWSDVTFLFRAWDESQNYKMVIQNGSLKFYKCYWEGGKQSKLLLETNKGIAEGEQIHLQIISWGWTKKVLINGECVFQIVEDAFTVGRIYVETWQAGLTFINPTYTEYDSDAELAAVYGAELDKPCVNKSVAELLAEAKEEAKTAIASYLQNVEATYSEAKRAEIAGIINAGGASIDACATIDEVAPVVDAIKAQLDNVMTLEEEAALEASKVAAKAEIAGYLTNVETLYSPENQALIATIIANSASSIDQCGSEVEVKAALNAIKQQLDEVLTMDEEGDQELLAKRTEAIAVINAYLTDVEATYSAEKQAEIAQILAEGKSAINRAETMEAVDEAVVAIKTALDDVLTMAEEVVAQEAAMAETFMNSLVHVNGTNFLNDEYMSIQDGKLVFNTRKASLGGQFKFGKQDGNMHKVFDTYMTIDYNSTKWDYVTIRFCAWDTSSNWKMVIKHDSIQIYYCKYGQDPIQVIEHAGGIPDNQEVHLQILTRGWTKMVVLDGVCIFKYWPNVAHNGFTMIETWESAITFRAPIYKEYGSEDAITAEYGDVLDKSSVNEILNEVQ